MAFKTVDQSLQFHRRNLSHWQRGGETYFVTFRTICRALDAEDRAGVLRACRDFDGTRFALWAAVVMPDHAHLLLQPLERCRTVWWPLSAIMHSIKSFTANHLNRRYHRRGPFWLDENFDRIVPGEVEFGQKWNYIRMNPVTRGLCEKPEDWDALYERGRGEDVQNDR
jgi:REP element-mobilizing transposase RayT